MKRLIFIISIFLLIGCGGGNETDQFVVLENSALPEFPGKPETFVVKELTIIPIPIAHAYNKVVNVSLEFRKTIVFFDLALFLYGSYDTGKEWWNEVHPYYYFYDGDPFFGMYVYTGKHQIWIPVKVDDQGMVWINPYTFAHEFTHFLTMIDEQILSSDKWGY